LGPSKWAQPPVDHKFSGIIVDGAKRILAWFVALAGCACLALLSYRAQQAGPFCYTSVCGQCGTLQQTTEWQLPHGRFTFFRRSSERATPLSSTLLMNGIIAPHRHEWVFANGGGNGITCAIGEGSYIRPVVESPAFARLIDTLHRHGQNALRDKVLRGAFDPSIAHLVYGLTFSVPTNGFADSADLRAWIGKQSACFDDATALFKNK
jgi:hypothetical protein